MLPYLSIAMAPANPSISFSSIKVFSTASFNEKLSVTLVTIFAAVALLTMSSPTPVQLTAQCWLAKFPADEIVKDLTEKGKSILYINFGVDKSIVSEDGKEIVNEIAEALKKDKTLKISIEGHTDNTGDAAHNKKLSNDRATAVMNALHTNGIDKPRLSAKGFGAEQPLVANDSEEKKAKNRRVELVRIN